MFIYFIIFPGWDVNAASLCFLFSSVTVVLFCMAALIFPMGFYIDEVGGQPYKLPNNSVVGSSYVLFVLSIFFTIVGLLFAGKVCLPGWQTLFRHFFLFVYLEKQHYWLQMLLDLTHPWECCIIGGGRNGGAPAFPHAWTVKLLAMGVEIVTFHPSALFKDSVDA